MINDITGLQNSAMQDCVAEYNVPAIIMHMQGTPQTMQENPQYTDVVDDIITFFETQIAQCEKKRITKIILDPGFGFGKTVAQNLEILRRFREFQILGKPLLIGTSRKSFIQTTIGGTPNDRLEGTIATNVLAAWHGAQIFRVHDVKACKRALDLTAQILQGERTWKEQLS
jgi:dihydropteroate synthase